MNQSARTSSILVILAFAAVYLIWGSTYLGIAIAIRSIPPMMMAGSRFLLAGLMLFCWCYFVNNNRAALQDWKENSIAGALMIFAGNGAVVWVEQYLPTGLVAVAVASLPVWLAVLDRRNWKFTFSRKMPVIGLITGFAGVILLFSGGKQTSLSNSSLAIASIPVLIAGNISWAAGTLYSQSIKSATPIFMRVSIQMLSGGLLYAFAAVLTGEFGELNLDMVQNHSLLAVLYLILCGSLMGYVAYIWLLSVRPAAQVGTFAYVNPVVAVMLGWLVLNENITLYTVFALIIILSGVVLINLSFKNVKR